jgi:hypothetical protein
MLGHHKIVVINNVGPEESDHSGTSIARSGDDIDRLVVEEPCCNFYDVWSALYFWRTCIIDLNPS